jgi:hypothetical protein
MGNLCQACNRYSIIERQNSNKQDYTLSECSLPKENISEYSKEE